MEPQSPISPPTKHEKASYVAQIVLRTFAVVCTLSGMWLMLTNKESKIVWEQPMDASYRYSSAFIFNIIANAIACGCTVVSLFAVVMLGGQGSDPAVYFFLFIHDLIMTILVIAGCAASTSFGWVGMYGNSRAGWMGTCDYFGKFCHRVATSLVFSYLSFFFLLGLTVMSASKSRRIHV